MVRLIEVWQYLYHISAMRWEGKLKSMLMTEKDPFILYSQHYGCWWPSDVGTQGINSNIINLILLEYSGFYQWE